MLLLQECDSIGCLSFPYLYVLAFLMSLYQLLADSYKLRVYPRRFIMIFIGEGQ